MRIVLQRVKSASLEADGVFVDRMGAGILAMVGIESGDDQEAVMRYMLDKLVHLRIFEDENGKTNLSIGDVGGSMLVISQFTLYADCRKGNRPSFIKAGEPGHANELYEYLIDELRDTYNINTSTGSFGADMQVSLVNDGPFTVMLDSDDLF